MTEKRFTIIYNEHLEMRQYVDNCKEEPNRWAIWNASETAQKMNKLNDENEQLRTALKELKEIGDYQYGRIKELYKENDELKEEIKTLRYRLSSYETE